MLSRVHSSAVIGIDAYPVEVEVDIANGLPSFHIVGLPDTACRESGDRVRAALKNGGYSFPAKRVTVNLAPADLKKEGSAFDLAIAIGILVANETLPAESVEGKLFVGELSLDGKLRGVPGILPRAADVKTRGGVEFVVPWVNAREALCVTGLPVRAAKRLSEVIAYLKDGLPLAPPAPEASPEKPAKTRASSFYDFADIKGQAHAKRGLEIAAAGGHNVLMIGPPGSGKTMLAKRVTTILSSISFDEAVETTMIHSVAGILPLRSSLVSARPFRDPHHTISDVALIGGGTHPKPGEVSLAHNGVLFLDELAEFRRNVLEVLRQPIEEGRVTISRAAATLNLPARFMLVAAMNPCPCGYATDPRKECHCSPLQIKNYLSKVSGPLLDRIDIQLEVPGLKAGEITGRHSGERSAVVRGRVEAARERQRARYRSEGISSNAELQAQQVERHCRIHRAGEELLKKAVQELGFSARAYHKCLKVARTIADLEGREEISSGHVSEAVQYRTLDQAAWLGGII